jgi:hypothetical protein
MFVIINLTRRSQGRELLRKYSLYTVDCAQCKVSAITMAGQRPLSHKKQGDWRLVSARQVVRENEELISPSDLGINRERITQYVLLAYSGLCSLQVSAPTVNMDGQQPSSQERWCGPPLDRSGTLTWKLLHFLASGRPSTQEQRGDGRLDDARNLARENQQLITPTDLEIIRERITL